MSPRKSKHVVAECRHCCKALGGSRRPVGTVYQLPDGWAVRRWSASELEPVVSGLAGKSDGFLVLWALKHEWRTVAVRFRRSGERRRIELEPSPWGVDAPATPPVNLGAWLRDRRQP